MIGVKPEYHHHPQNQHSIQYTSLNIMRRHQFKSLSVLASISSKQSLITSTSSSPLVLLPCWNIFSPFLLYREGWTRPSFLFESTWARHLHVPATRLFVEDRFQRGVIKSFVAEEVGALAGLMHGQGLVIRWLGTYCSWVVLLLCEWVKVWANWGWA